MLFKNLKYEINYVLLWLFPTLSANQSSLFILLISEKNSNYCHCSEWEERKSF